MKPNNSSIHHMGSTLPPPSNPGVGEDGRKRSTLEPQQLLMPEPFQSIPAQELLKDNCGKCGWIRKEGGSVKTWRDRYVILHKGCLYYYYKPEATMTAGKFSLSGYRLSPAPEKSSKYQWTFKLVHLQPEKRTYYFAAYSEREMNEWMENISKEMAEYCGTGKQHIAEPTDFGDGVEYCYPEVEPKFDPEEFAALFGKPLPSLPRHPTTSEPMYCPPPEMDPRDVPKKPPRLPRPPPLAYQHGSEWPKGCSLPHAASPFLGPVKLPSAGSSPVSPRSKRASPAVPSRLEKPLVEPAPSTPPKPKPKPLPRPPPIRKRATEPVSTYGGCSEGPDEDELSEGYLDIVPDTTPEDVFDDGKNSTLSRGFPDGKSFRQNTRENVLPPSALRLDMDKTAVTTLLENKLGVYIVRESQNAQSKRALAVWTGDRVRHYMIFYEEKTGYALDPEGAYFETLRDLLWHYHDVTLPRCDAKLIRPFK